MLLCLLCTTAFSQSADKEEHEKEKDQSSIVPANVKAAFIKEYPNIKKFTWEKEGNSYEVEFNLKNVETSIVYDATAHKKETESIVPINNLPLHAKEYISEKYPSYKITEASKIVNDTNIVIYEAEITLDKKLIDLIFDANGTFIKEEVED